MITLTIWSDFACPYCYIGERRLQHAIEELGLQQDVQIDYRAFELDPTAPKDVTTTTPERFAKKYHLSIEDATKQVNEISRLGREVGIDFRYATALYSNTRDAHRVMKMAEVRYDRPTVERLNEALFAAYFTENLVLSDPEVLAAKAESAGMNPDDVRAMLKTDEYADEVRFDEREAAMRGVRGVPYVVFNGGFAVPGALSTEGFKSALRRELRKQESEPPTEKGHECGPGGCKL